MVDTAAGSPPAPRNGPPYAIASGLVVVGLVALATSAWLIGRGTPRPSASGEAGRLEAYAQLPNGPARLWPGRPRTLPRPQHLAFRFTAEGTGPRTIRIEVDTSVERITAYERRHHAPANGEGLDYVLRLGEDMPDRIDVWVTIEAPHTQPVSSWFPIVLQGPRRRFWERSERDEPPPSSDGREAPASLGDRERSPVP